MVIALHWREGHYHCEFQDAPDGGTLSIFVEGQLVCRELVRSAAAAVARARELQSSLLSSPSVLRAQRQS